MSLPVSFFLLFLFLSFILSPIFFLFILPSSISIYIYLYVSLSFSTGPFFLLLPSFRLASSFLSRRSPPVVPSWLMENPRACASRERSFGGRKGGKSEFCCPLLLISPGKNEKRIQRPSIRNKNRGRREFAPISPSDYRARIVRSNGRLERKRKRNEKLGSKTGLFASTG